MTEVPQIQNLVERLRKRLKDRSANEGVPVSELVEREISRALDRPSRKQVLAAIREEPETARESGLSSPIHEQRGRL